MEKKNNDTQARPPQDETVMALIGLPATLITAGVCLLIIGISTYPPLDLSPVLRMALIYGGAVAAVYIAIGAYLLRQRGDGRKIKGIFIAVSLCGIPASALGSIIAANGALDRSPPNMLPTMVMEKEIDNQTWSTLLGERHTIYVSSWRATGHREKLAVGKDIYDRVTPFKNKMIVTTKSGWLGFEWVSSINLVPGAPGSGSSGQ
ncbi:MAG: hypothetical protein OEZ32_08980 [Nitrospinota bacterium]|nr:hypothetical protein [Nitrospinota bacterium]